MKEQWKKLDNDAKLLVDVEEGNQLPIKINIPLSALAPPRDEFCCNRLLTILRVCVLLALLTLLGWTATTLYCNYYDKAIPLDQENLENKFVFQSLVYKNKDAVDTDDQFKNSDPEVFRDSTKKALDQIATEMKGFNERLDQLQVEKEQQQMHMKTPWDDKKSFDDEITSEHSDQTLDSMFDELAKEVGLAENQLSDEIHVENKPELGAIIITESQDQDFSDLEFEQAIMELSHQLKRLNIKQGMAVRIPVNIDKSPKESNDRAKLFGDFPFQPTTINNEFWKENSNAESELDGIFRNRHIVKNDNINDEIQKAFSDMLGEIAAEAEAAVNVDENHEEDKEVDQVIQAVINSMSTSNLDNDSEQLNEKEDKVEDETMEEQNENVVGSFMDGLIDGFIDALIGEENAKEDDLSESFDNENVEESPNEDKVEKEMIEQHEQDEMIRQIIGESLVDMVIHDLIEDGINMEEKSIEDGSSPSLFEGLTNFMVNDDGDKEDNPTSISEESNYHSIPFQTMSGETVIDSQLSENASEDGSSPSLFEGFFDFMLNNDENNDDNPTAISKENNYDSIPFYTMSGETIIDSQQSISPENASEDGSSPSLFRGFFDFNSGDNKEDDSTTIPEEKSDYITLPAGYISNQMTYPDPRFSSNFAEETASDFYESFLPKTYFEEPNTWNMENKKITINEQAPIQEDLSVKKTLVEMVPSVEYVKKIEENPFIPKVAKMLEPIVGPNHELLIWYYTHKKLPYFLRGADKWKVFGAKLLYDSNIKDYPADATIVSGLTFEKVYGGAEYPSSSEEVRSDLEQEIIDRLILKSYLNKMLLEGNAEAETLSQVIEQHNLEKLKELDIDPQQLIYMGDFFQVENTDNEDIMIPVVQFDPFVDESREANEQRVQVIRAFEKSRNMEDDKLRNGFFDSITSVASEQVHQPELSTTVIPEETKDNLENSRQASPQTSEDFISRSDDYGTSDEASEDFGRPVGMMRDPYESLDDWLTEFAPNDGPIRFRR